MRDIAIKQLFKQPIVVCSALLTCLWVLADINTRLIHQSKHNVQSNKVLTSTELPKMQLNSSQHAFIAQQYERFKEEEKTPAKAQTQLSAEQQLAQQGLMQQVFVNNNKLMLKAVISEQAGAVKKQEPIAYALIHITDQTTGNSKLVKVKNNQQIEDFTITISSNTQVELTRSTSQGEQHISLTMYRVADKIKQ